MIWYRVDNRLIHGQIIEAWLPYIGATRLVVANENLAGDALQQQIMLLAVPSRIRVDFLSLAAVPAEVRSSEAHGERTLVLFASCADARVVHDAGLRFGVLNIGNIHYAPGKRQICPHVALSEEDTVCLHTLADHDVILDFRCVPNAAGNVRDW